MLFLMVSDATKPEAGEQLLAVNLRRLHVFILRTQYKCQQWLCVCCILFVFAINIHGDLPQ
jgi:hypothetical protein